MGIIGYLKIVSKVTIAFKTFSCKIVSYGTINLRRHQMSDKIKEIKDRLEKLKDVSSTFSINEVLLTRLLFKTTKQFERIMDKKMNECGGLTAASWGVLMITYDNDGSKILPSELATIMRHPKSTITRLVDDLIKREFLAREHDSQDRRQVFITITKLGKQFIIDNMESHDNILKDIWEGCDIDNVITALGKALDNMEKKYD